MRDAASQCADAFHALRPHELGFDLLPLCDISIDREHRFGMPFIVSNDRPTRLNGDLAPVPSEVPEFAIPFALADRQPVGFFKLFWICVEKFANVPANDLLTRPAI